MPSGIVSLSESAHVGSAASAPSTQLSSIPLKQSSGQTVDYRAGLGDIKTPTLFISGAQDPAATPDYIKTMTVQMAGVGHVVVDPAGHISNLEAPDQFNRAMVDFLTAQEA